MNTLKQRLLESNEFVENEYLDKYVNLIEENYNQIRIKYKTQSHHILPRCYFNNHNLPIDNSKNNRVNLFHKDHVIAHYYIFLCAKSTQFKRDNALAVIKSLNFKDFKLSETYLTDSDFIKRLDKYSEVMEAAGKATGDRLRGTKRPPELMRQIGESLKKVEHTPEWNKKVGDAQRGRKMSLEAKAKMSEQQKGRIAIRLNGECKRVKPDELDKYLSDGWELGGLGHPAWNKGLTKETDKRMKAASDNMKGLKWTEEQRAKRRGAGNPMYGRSISRETREKIKQTKINNGTLNTSTPEKNAKISSTLKGYRTMFKGDIEKHVYPDQVSYYLSQGYQFGQKPKKFK